MVFIDGVYLKFVSLIHEYSGMMTNWRRVCINFLISRFVISEDDPNKDDFIGNVVGQGPEADTFFTDLYFIGKSTHA